MITDYKSLPDAAVMRDGSHFVNGKHLYYTFKPKQGETICIGSKSSSCQFRGDSFDQLMNQFLRQVMELKDLLSISGFHVKELRLNPNYLIKPNYSDLPAIQITGYQTWNIISIPEQKQYITEIERAYLNGCLELNEFVNRMLCLDCLDLEKKTACDLPYAGLHGEKWLASKGYRLISSVATADPIILANKTGCSMKSANMMIRTACHWLETIQAHRPFLEKIEEGSINHRNENKIDIFINNLFDECVRTMPDIRFYGVVCAKSGGEILSVNRDYNFAQEYFDVQTEPPTIDHLLSLIQKHNTNRQISTEFGINEEILRSLLRNKIEGDPYFVEIIHVPDLENSLSIILIGHQINLGLLGKIFRRYEQFFKEICPNTDELKRLVSVAKEDFTKKIESIRKNKHAERSYYPINNQSNKLQ